MRSRLRERFNVDFSFEDIFDCATVSALAAPDRDRCKPPRCGIAGLAPATAIEPRSRSSSSGCICSRGSI
jgi:hypothetical protein